MKKYKDLGIYDFSDYAEEITGDDLFKVNGGAQVANTNQGVANAKVGDTVTRNDGTTVTITQGDFNWAQQQIDSSASSGNNAQQQGPGSSGSGYNPGGATETEKKEKTPAVQAQKNWTYNPNEPDSDKRYNAKDFNGLHIMTIGFDDAKNFEDFASYYTTIGQNGAAGTTVYDGIGLTDKDGNIIHVLREEKAIQRYAKYALNCIEESEGNFSDVLNNMSTIAGLVNDVTRRTVINADKIKEMTGVSINTVKISKISKSASNISKYTGAIGLGLNIKNFKNKPTFRNFSNVVSSSVGFIPGAGPYLSVGISVGGEAIADSATEILEPISCIASRKYQFDSILNNVKKENSFGVFSVVDKNMIYAGNLGVIEGLKFLFQ